MEKLIEKINDRIDSFEVEELPEEYELSMELFETQLLNSLDQVSSDFLVCYPLLLFISYLGMDKGIEIIKLLNGCFFFFTYPDLTNELYFKYSSAIETLHENDALDEIDSEIIKNSKYAQEINKVRSIEEIFNQSILEEGNVDFKALRNLYKLIDNNELFFSFIEIGYIKKLKNELPDIEDYKGLVRKKDYNRIMKNAIDRMIKDNKFKINDNIKLIRDYYSNLKSKQKKQKTKINKYVRDYKLLIDSLIKNENRYIGDIKSDIKLIEDDDILTNYLFYVIKHNVTYNNKLEDEYNDLARRQVSNLEIIFNKYNLNFNLLNKNNQVIISECNDVEEKIQSLISKDLSVILDDENAFVSVLQKSSVEIINNIGSIFKNYDFADEFILNNINIFTLEKLYLNFKNNIRCLKELDINKVIRYDADIFMMDFNDIQNRFNLFKNYYNMNLYNLYNFEFLKNDEIFNILDNFIEYGYYDQIKEYPEHLSCESKNIIKRIKIAKLLGINVLNEDGSFIGPIVSGKNFYVSDDKLDEFGIDYKDLYLDALKLNKKIGNQIDLDDEKYLSNLTEYEDGIMYKIDDMILSKPRILRNINSLKNENSSNLLIDALLIGSIDLSNDDIHKLNKLVGNKMKTK